MTPNLWIIFKKNLPELGKVCYK